MAEELNTGNPKFMKELMDKVALGNTTFWTDDGDMAVLVKEENVPGAILHISQDEKPNWDIVIYFDEDGKKEGEGVKPTIINRNFEDENIEASQVSEALEVLSGYYGISPTVIRHLIEKKDIV